MVAGMPVMNSAREEILRAANRVSSRPLARRHLQQAVCIVRHQGLVSEDVLRRAGFNAHKRRG